MRRKVSPDVQRAIAETAYFISEQQGFVPGHELENWLTAERQVLGRGLNTHAGHLADGTEPKWQTKIENGGQRRGIRGAKSATRNARRTS